MRAAGFAAVFLDVLHAAELGEGATACLGGSDSFGDKIGDLLLDVEAQFGVELRVLLLSAK